MTKETRGVILAKKPKKSKFRKENLYQEMRCVKCVLVGDESVGKSSLLLRYTTDIFTEQKIESVLDNYCAHIYTGGCHYNLLLWDVTGNESFKRMRPIAYAQTDVFLLCFSLDSPSSLESVCDKWNFEVKKSVPEAKVILVGLKEDLLYKKQGAQFVCKERTNAVAKMVGAQKYIECSSKTKKNVSKIFQEVARLCSDVEKEPLP